MVVTFLSSLNVTVTACRNMANVCAVVSSSDTRESKFVGARTAAPISTDSIPVITSLVNAIAIPANGRACIDRRHCSTRASKSRFYCTTTGAAVTADGVTIVTRLIEGTTAISTDLAWFYCTKTRAAVSIHQIVIVAFFFTRDDPVAAHSRRTCVRVHRSAA
jgi:hypothetical protein